jgi:hypothetical protein
MGRKEKKPQVKLPRAEKPKGRGNKTAFWLSHRRRIPPGNEADQTETFSLLQQLFVFLHEKSVRQPCEVWRQYVQRTANFVFRRPQPIKTSLLMARDEPLPNFYISKSIGKRPITAQDFGPMSFARATRAKCRPAPHLHGFIPCSIVRIAHEIARHPRRFRHAPHRLDRDGASAPFTREHRPTNSAQSGSKQ